MVQVEGTYTSVKNQDFVDFYVHLGIDKEKAHKALGSHWTMKLWKDGDVWGGHFTCKELPHLNCLETFVEGVDKCVDVPMFGGKAKVSLKKTGDGEFVTTIHSEKFGTMTLEEKYCDEGAQHKLTAKGKTITEHWERQIKVEGAYRFDKGENVESFFKTVGDLDMIKHYKDYKVYFCKTGHETFNMTECFGALGRYTNTLKLDVEAPFKVPGDKEGSEGSYKALVTKVGVGKCLMILKTPTGSIQEWKMCFRDCGLVLTGLDKKSGQTCTFHNKRFVETSGTYKVVSMVGFEKFAHTMGMPCSKINEIVNDCSARFVICNKGDGHQRHQLIGKNHSVDFTFKLNEEFTFAHPFLHENVKAVATMHDHTLCMSVHTSKGTIKNSIHFNDTFIVKTVCMPGAHIGYKTILERCWH